MAEPAAIAAAATTSKAASASLTPAWLPPWLVTVAATVAARAAPATAAAVRAAAPHLPLAAAVAAGLAGARLLCTAAAASIAAGRTLSSWPSPPAASALLGHAAALATPAHHLVLARWARDHGRAYALRVAWKWAVVITDPVAATAILDGRPARTGLDKGALYSRFNSLNPDPGRGTVFTSPSDAHWAAVRAAVAPCFTARAVKARFKALAGPPAAAAAWLVAKAEKRGGGGVSGGGRDSSRAAGTAASPCRPCPTPPSSTLFDVDDLMMRAALDAVASACFGLSCGAVPLPGAAPTPAAFEVMRACQDWLNETAMAPWRAAMRWTASSRAGRVAIAAKKAYALSLADAIAGKGGGGTGGGGGGGSHRGASPAVAAAAEPAEAERARSASAALLSVVDPSTGAPLSRARLAGEAVTLLEAGFETTGHTAAYALALLARHPAAAAKAEAELRAGGWLWEGGREGRALSSSADLARLPYLAACVKEAMRLLPVVADGPVRTAGRTVTVAGEGGRTLTIPAGTLVLVPFLAAGRDAGAWGGPADAHAFRPERWLEEEEEEEGRRGGGEGGGGPPSPPPPPTRVYAPFSRGPRACVGAALGSAMALTLVASVLARVEVGWPGGGGGAVGPTDAASELPPLEDSLEIRLTLQPKAPLMLVATPRA
jgi:fatty acid synthase